MITIGTSANPYMHAGLTSGNQTGGLYAVLLPIPALTLLGTFLAGNIRNRRLAGKRRIISLVGSFALLLVMASLLVASGCGYSANNPGNGTQRGTTTMMITGTAGSLTHSTSVSLTVQ
jgi:hypothetical protein